MLKFYSCHHHGNQPALEGYVSKEIHDHIKKIILADNMNDPWYIMKQKVHPFFQGGSIYTQDGWILIEFWTNNISGAYKFCQEMLKPFNIHLIQEN